MRIIGISSIFVTFALVAAGCGKNKKGEPPPSPHFADDRPARPATTASQPGTATVTAVGEGADTAPDVGAVYFEFDSVTLSNQAREALERLADWLEYRDNHVTIEGHADERGTTEYNVALGQRRAEVIAEYLARLGIPHSCLDTISYGEERPADDGNHEAAWARNRRGEIQPR